MSLSTTSDCKKYKKNVLGNPGIVNIANPECNFGIFSFVDSSSFRLMVFLCLTRMQNQLTIFSCSWLRPTFLSRQRYNSSYHTLVQCFMSQGDVNLTYVIDFNLKYKANTLMVSEIRSYCSSRILDFISFQLKCVQEKQEETLHDEIDFIKNKQTDK